MLVVGSVRWVVGVLCGIFVAFPVWVLIVNLPKNGEKMT